MKSLLAELNMRYFNSANRLSYIILISVLSQFYEWGYGKKKYKKEETPNSIKYIERSERVTGVLFLILFIYNVFFTQ